MSEREAFLRRFHAEHAGITARGLARTGCYARLAARVPRDARVLDLGCGDGALLAHLPPSAIGLDLSRDELRGVPRVVQGRAQALPFGEATFDVVTCHLAFMLFDEVERVVSELRRVLAPGGRFLAVVGGGPVAGGDDAFHRFAALLAPHASPALGDRRAGTERGWRELFAAWSTPVFERWELDVSGTFDEVWAFLGASYQLPAEVAPDLRARLATEYGATRVPCRVVTWCATAEKPITR